MVTIAVPAEAPGETRVAATPETVKKFGALNCTVQIQQGAGAHSKFSDAEYGEMGAVLKSSASETVSGADVVLTVLRPSLELVGEMKPGAVLVGMLDPYGERDGLEGIAKAGVTAFTMEFMPRISRAQSMDVLSSQANLAGYKAVIDAAAAYGRGFPMMMTAAGTVPAAKVFIMGVGVGGLQAIATARRLGAIVTATDVRPATKEQVASLGGKFVAVEDEEFKQAETSSGYAKEMSDEYKQKQAALIAEHVKSQDVIVTTAFVPGRPAPTLITAEMVKSMKPGAVILDMAAERGGNCELTKPGETIVVDGVTIIGAMHLAGLLAGNASSLYSRNLLAFVQPQIDKESGELKIEWDDETVSGTLIARDGEIVHRALKKEAAE